MRGLLRRKAERPNVTDEGLDLLLNVDEIDDQMADLVGAIEDLAALYRRTLETEDIDFVDFHREAGHVIGRFVPGIV